MRLDLLGGLLATLASAAAFAAPAAPAAAPRQALEQPSDGRIEAWVREAIAEDPRAKGARIRVEVNHGVVSLFGSSDSLAAKKFAVLQAKKILGVLGVIDQIEIASFDIPDAVVIDAVLKRIETSAAVEPQDLQVTSELGAVVLSGEVASTSQRQQAELLAIEVRGVKSVDNQLEVDARLAGSREDDDLLRDVTDAIGRDVYLNGLPITARVKDGVVTLDGSVGSAYEKERASSETGWISGVAGVDNQLKVVWWGDRPTRIPRPGPADDATLRDALLAELAVDDRLDGHAIQVTAASGLVTLRGAVPTEHQRRLAEEDARNVVGVAWVRNALRVVTPERPDAELASEIRESLAADSTLHASGVRVSVTDGVATLEGEVASEHRRSHAGAIASRIRGVRAVDNQLRTSDAATGDEELAREIRARIERDWRTAFVSERVRVDVKSGVVTLSGDVDRWSERRSAERIAARTPGVRGVVNDLSVADQPYPPDEGEDEHEPPPSWDPYYFDFPELPWIA